jgi:glycine/D-amino acid oxidase-like deaminating enzyme
LAQLIRHSAELYASLEAETGQATGWLRTGSLSIATNPDRLIHIKRQASLARLYGVEAHVVDAAETADLWPFMRGDDVIGAVFSPDDGRVNPSDVCAALIKAAKASGVQVFEDTPVTGSEKQAGRISAVTTESGRIACQSVVLCAGLWSRQVAALAGVSAPLYACISTC